ncbi:MAG: glycosyltransferase [Oscillatoria sp. PMC 1051.18]|nr:glycosyltransferase [Oscillatoria sp. PMC 1050.18]MEC5029309.1 glycosyltransferase [Oscillatoria sp. PMC 1051.18]
MIFQPFLKQVKQFFSPSQELTVNQEKKLKILVLTDYFNATYYTGFYYPLRSLAAKKVADFTALCHQDIIDKINKKNPDLFWQQLLQSEQPDAVIFNRYGLAYGRFLLAECQQKQIPTIYFIDDDLLNITPVLGEEIQKRLGNPEVITERKHLLENVDLIYSSTEYLAKKLAKVFPQQQIFDGVYPPYLGHLVNKKPAKEKKADSEFKFGYMGSKGHNQDLRAIAPAIAQVLTDYPQTKFEIFGTVSLPEELTCFGDRIKAHKVIKQFDKFLQQLYQLNWDVGLAPIEDTEFNRCKSLSKYLEYTAAEIPIIARNLNVYNQTINSENGLLANQDEWYEKITLLLHKPELRNELIAGAKQTCSTKFKLEFLAEQHLQIIESLRDKN